MRFICSLVLITAFHSGYSQNVESFGVFGGFNVPITFDEGLNKDFRYEGKVTFRGTPVGFTYGYDHVGFGVVLTPSLTKIGQKFLIKNTVGGDVGLRDVEMDYFNFPVALKLHLNDLSFFRLSAVAAINFTYLLNGRETISYSASKQRYPSSVLIPSEPGYIKVFDGVLVPEVNNLEYVSKDQYNAFQLFAAVGLRSDFDLSDDWSLNFDGRANFGLFDPRKKDYIEQLKQTSDAPDLYGTRHEIYLSAEIGIARIIQIKKTYEPKRSSKPLISSKPSAPKQNSRKILTKKKKKKKN
ncbi:MAG TPA: outer membrane beta-barrel protein [Cyclobacteriaceae bacterium]|nr:PorT family protein [Cyclobacteriaceae bacterium]HNP08682.1 outer membrane beta-barrel protein [Cyclobacteriaceae bacterium]HRK53408.1 outer membrane beta-barrel protein [Cyclobacteriaceae bacterium]